jgi:hypothetical protein
MTSVYVHIVVDRTTICTDMLPPRTRHASHRKGQNKAMGTYITVVLGPKKRKGAKIENSGLKFRGRLYYPAAVHPLQGTPAAAAASLAAPLPENFSRGPSAH